MLKFSAKGPKFVRIKNSNKKSEIDSRVTIAHGHLSGNVIFLSRFMEMPLCGQEQIYARAKEAKADFTAWN